MEGCHAKPHRSGIDRRVAVVRPMSMRRVGVRGFGSGVFLGLNEGPIAPLVWGLLFAGYGVALQVGGPTRFGIVRPRVQIPGPRPFSRRSATLAAASDRRIAAGSISLGTTHAGLGVNF